MDLALEDHPIHKNQHGFQRGLSTETAISKTVNYIEKHINSDREVLGVFLDIQAAFDTICPKHIKARLLKHGADPDLAEFYYNYRVVPLIVKIFLTISGQKRQICECTLNFLANFYAAPMNLQVFV